MIVRAFYTGVSPSFVVNFSNSSSVYLNNEFINRITRVLFFDSVNSSLNMSRSNLLISINFILINLLNFKLIL
jgi:hypothetical protein